MCKECGCGLDTGLACPECGGRMVLINNQATCLEWGQGLLRLAKAFF
jgi:hypothetical protein